MTLRRLRSVVKWLVSCKQWSRADLIHLSHSGNLSDPWSSFKTLTGSLWGSALPHLATGATNSPEGSVQQSFFCLLWFQGECLIFKCGTGTFFCFYLKKKQEYQYHNVKQSKSPAFNKTYKKFKSEFKDIPVQINCNRDYMFIGNIMDGLWSDANYFCSASKREWVRTKWCQWMEGLQCAWLSQQRPEFDSRVSGVV